MAKKLITLAKELDFKTEHEYFDYMIDSYINGQFGQCRNLFYALRKEDKKAFIRYCDVMEIREFYFAHM